jgi:hypothetical protein
MSGWRKATPEQVEWCEAVSRCEIPPPDYIILAATSGTKPENNFNPCWDVRQGMAYGRDTVWLKPTGPLPESFPAWPDEGIVTFGAEDLTEAEAEAITKEPTPMSILQEAQAIVNGDRAADYGDSTRNMERIGALTALMLREDEWAELDEGNFPASVVAKVLIAVKLGRESFKHKRDNLLDLCGYAEILNRVEEKYAGGGD